MKNKLKKNPAKVKGPSLSLEITEAFMHFMEYHHAGRFSKNLRKFLLEFLQHDGAIEAIYLNDLLYDLEGLFALLDVIQDEGEKEDNN